MKRIGPYPFALLPPSLRPEIEAYLTTGRPPRSAVVRSIFANNLQDVISVASTQERADLLGTVLWLRAYTEGLPLAASPATAHRLSTVSFEIDVDTEGGHFVIPIRLTGRFESAGPTPFGSMDPPDGPDFSLVYLEWMMSEGIKGKKLEWEIMPEGFLPERVLGELCSRAAQILNDQRENIRAGREEE